jgi:Tfp pilus assembly protein PilF
MSEGRLDDAVLSYRAALAIKPDFAFAHNNLGAALIKAGRPAEAVPHFRVAAARPNYPQAHVNWAEALIDLGREAEAMEHYAEAARLAPREALVPYYNLGLYYRRKGDIPKGRGYLEKALEIAVRQGNSALARRIRADLQGLDAP